MTRKIQIPVTITPVYQLQTRQLVAKAYQNIRHDSIATMGEVWTIDEDDVTTRGAPNFWGVSYANKTMRRSVSEVDSHTLERFGATSLLIRGDDLHARAAGNLVFEMVEGHPYWGTAHVIAFPAGMLAIFQNVIDRIKGVMFDEGVSEAGPDEVCRAISVALDEDASNHAKLQTLSQINMMLDALRNHMIENKKFGDPDEQEISKYRYEAALSPQ